MKLLVLIAVILSISSLICLPKFIASVALTAQTACIELRPNLSAESSTLTALVCGQKISDKNTFADLQATGLIHIFVVSAGHLVVLSEILIFFGMSRFFLTLILFFFSIVTGWQAPCVRSLIGLGISFYLSKRKLYLSPPQTVFFTGLLTLSLFPEWCQSFSLQLSWAAALALSAASTFKNKNHSEPKHMMITSLWIFLILLPFLQRVGGVHPLSMLWNITLGSLTAFVLFPFSFLGFLNPFFLQLLESLMKLFWWTLKLSHDFKFIPLQEPSSFFRGWVWIFSLHLFLHLTSIFYQRIYKT